MADVDGRNDEQVAEDALGMMDDPVDDAAVLEGLEEEDEVTRESTEGVLARLKSDDPSAARVVGAMQTQMSRMQNEWRDLQGELISTLTALRAQPSDEVDEGVEEELPEGITIEHIETFKRMADHLGYVPREELVEREVAQEVEGHAEEDLAEGVKLYGEAFGTVNEAGEVEVNEETLARLRQAHDRIFDPKIGLTLLDLYKMEYGPPAPKAAAVAPRSGARPTSRAGVARRSTGGGRELKIYDAKRGDSRDSVFDRAFALTRRELGS